MRLLVCVLGLALSLGAPARACEMNLVSTLPVRQLGSDLLVPITMNGQQAEMIFDTGAAISLVTQAAATRVGLRVIHREEGSSQPILAGGIGGARAALVMKAHTMDIGGLHARDMDIAVSDFMHPPIDGLLSLDLIAKFDVDLDVIESKIMLYRPRGDCSAPAAFLAQPLYPIPLRPTGEDPRPRITVQVGSQTVIAAIDTGAYHSAIFRGAADRLGLHPAALTAEPVLTVNGIGPRAVRAVRHAIEPVTIGDLEFSNMRLDVLDDAADDEVEMLLGADFLQTVHLWISYSSHTLILQYPPQASKKAG